MAITKISPSVVDFDDGITITVDDNSDTLTLTSTDADATLGPVLNLYRNSSSPADSDVVGSVKYVARNDNSQDVTTFTIQNYITDVSDGTEDAASFFYLMEGGSLRERLGFGSSATIFNEDGLDVDFRVESDGNTRAISILGDKYGLGVGRDPETAYNGYASVELGQQGAILANEAGDDFWFGSNVYLDGSGNSTRKEAGVAALLQIDGDVISWYTAGSGSADTTISWSMKNRFSSDGNLSFLSGQGIDFSATGDGSGTDSSELFNDYEEGTFTPAFDNSVTVATANGRYTKIGRVVNFSIEIGTSVSNITGNVTAGITGLPYAVAANQAAGSCFSQYVNNGPFTTVYVYTTGPTVYLYEQSSSSYHPMQFSDMNDSSAFFYIQGTYKTS